MTQAEHHGPQGQIPTDGVSQDTIMQHAVEAAALLKAMAHEGRVMSLYHLVSGEKTVTRLEQLLAQRQAAVSQQLARLRAEGLVRCRREGKARLYSIDDRRAAAVVTLLHRLYCPAHAAMPGPARH